MRILALVLTTLFALYVAAPPAHAGDLGTLKLALQNYSPVGSTSFAFVSTVRPGSTINQATHYSSFPQGSYLQSGWAPGSCVSATFVCGYNFITVLGKYASDGPSFSLPNVATPAIQYSALQEFVTNFDFSIEAVSGTKSDFNVLIEYFSTANGMVDPTTGTRTVEIGWFPHISTAGNNFFLTQPLVGVFTDRWGRSWTVRKSGAAGAGFAMVRPTAGGDYLRGSLDWKALLTFLQAQGVVSASEYVNGYAVGVETYANENQLRINYLDTVKR